MANQPEPLPREPEAFTEAVARRLAERWRHDVEMVGAFTVKAGRETLDLNDLYRQVIAGEVADERAAVERFVDDVLAAEQLRRTDIPFDLVGSRVLPRIQTENSLRGHQREFVAHQPFVNDTLILYVVELDQASAALSMEQLIRWGVSVDELDRMARDNLARSRPTLEVELSRRPDGTIATLETGDGYESSRLLLGQLYEALAPELGGEFLVAIPSRDEFLAGPIQPEHMVDQQQRLAEDHYRKRPHPITSRLFVMTRDGVAEWRDAA